MWIKLPDRMVMWQDDRATAVYNEAELRRCIRSYLSDESRARFGREKAGTEESYIKGLDRLTQGLKVLLAEATATGDIIKSPAPDTTPVWPAYVFAFGIAAIIMIGQIWWQNHHPPELPQKTQYIDEKSKEE